MGSDTQTVKKENNIYENKSDEKEKQRLWTPVQSLLSRASAMRKRLLTLAEDQLIGGVSFSSSDISVSERLHTTIP